VDLGNLRRSLGASTKGGLLGERELYRTARGLRRSQTIRRSNDNGLPPLSPRRYANRANLQHVRSANALARWARRSGVYRTGPDRAITDGVRGRIADSLILLRVRFNRWDFQACDERFSRTGEHRQSARDDDQTVCGGNHPDHRDEIVYRIQTVACGRPKS